MIILIYLIENNKSDYCCVTVYDSCSERIDIKTHIDSAIIDELI